MIKPLKYYSDIHEYVSKYIKTELKKLPKPKSLLTLGMITKSNNTDNIFLVLIGMHFARTICYRQRSLSYKAHTNSYKRLKNKASSNQRSMKYIAKRG